MGIWETAVICTVICVGVFGLILALLDWKKE